MEPLYFRSADEFRAWLDAHHADATEVLVGFHKTATGEPTMTWSESVDQALCFGWIDGVRRRVDDRRYTIRFTPRKATSTWSNVNVAKVEALTAAGLMHPAGLAAFARRTGDRTGTYAFEQGAAELAPEFEDAFRAHASAWGWWERQPPGYRRGATHWVMSAKRDDTRRSRFATLLADAAAGRRIKHLRRD